MNNHDKAEVLKMILEHQLPMPAPSHYKLGECGLCGGDVMLTASAPPYRHNGLIIHPAEHYPPSCSKCRAISTVEVPMVERRKSKRAAK